MSLRALVAAAAIVAILVAAVARRRSAATVPMLVLTIVVALSAYHSAEARVRAIHGLPVRAPGIDMPPPDAGATGYRAIAGDALAHIPPAAPYAIVALRQTQGLFWVRYVLAPRIRVDPARTHWVIVVGGSPQKAGLRPRRSWRAGDAWLVHTRSAKRPVWPPSTSCSRSSGTASSRSSDARARSRWSCRRQSAC